MASCFPDSWVGRVRDNGKALQWREKYSEFGPLREDNKITLRCLSGISKGNKEPWVTAQETRPRSQYLWEKSEK